MAREEREPPGALPRDHAWVARADGLRAGFVLEPLTRLDHELAFRPDLHLRAVHASPLWATNASRTTAVAGTGCGTLPYGLAATAHAKSRPLFAAAAANIERERDSASSSGSATPLILAAEHAA